MSDKGEQISNEGENFCPDPIEIGHLSTIYESPLFSNPDGKESEKLEERRRILQNGEDVGEMYELIFKRSYLRYLTIKTKDNINLKAKIKAPYVQILICIKGRYLLKVDHTNFTALKQEEYNVFLLFGKEVHIELLSDGEVEVAEINMSIDFFCLLFPPQNPYFQDFEKNIHSQIGSSMSLYHLPLQSKVTSIVHKMMNAPHRGYYKGLFMKANVVELIAHVFEQYENIHTSNPRLKLKKEDIDKMYHARKVIIGNLEAPLSLINLARAVGTNEFSLKKNFKAVFGTTVFGYLNSYKMETARILLLKGEHNIAEVARRVGYSQPSHFTSAFKKYFGILPNQVKEN